MISTVSRCNRQTAQTMCQSRKKPAWKEYHAYKYENEQLKATMPLSENQIEGDFGTEEANNELNEKWERYEERAETYTDVDDKDRKLAEENEDLEQCLGTSTTIGASNEIVDLMTARQTSSSYLLLCLRNLHEFSTWWA